MAEQRDYYVPRYVCLQIDIGLVIYIQVVSWFCNIIGRPLESMFKTDYLNT